MEAMKYYLVKAKCGHVGRKNYIPVTFAVVAMSRKEAAATAREIPRVKHDHHNAIFEVTQVSHEEYVCQKNTNSFDPYLWIRNRKEHYTLLPLFAHRIESEATKTYTSKREVSRREVYHKGERIRNPKKYFRAYNDALFVCDENRFCKEWQPATRMCA
ncbi:MAG: hypothetical protein FWH32_06805 [Clostridiales bacterium]|nr:hypothetical protein [Clostridiales bacterium]